MVLKLGVYLLRIGNFPDKPSNFQQIVSVLAGVMTSVISKLTALLGEEYTKLKGLHREVEFMKDELSSMNAQIGRAHV